MYYDNINLSYEDENLSFYSHIMVHELPLPSAFNQSYLHLSIHFMLFRTMPDRNRNSTAFI